MDPAIDIPEPLRDAALTKVPAGATIFRAGDACQNFLFVVEGSVRVDLTSLTGKAVLLYRITPGEACVMTTSCLLGGRNYAAEATAETDTLACVLPIARFQTKLDSDPAFRALVFGVFANRLGDMMDKVESVAFSSIDQRLARRILELRQMAGHDSIAITHEQLATDLGSSREVVSRKLARWAEMGLIHKAHRAIEIINTNQIARLAEAGD